MSNFKTLRGYLAPEFEVVNLNCEAGFSVSLEGLEGENWTWDSESAL